MVERVFDTGNVAACAQLEYWADHVCQAFTNLQISSFANERDGFTGRLAQRDFGPISIASAFAQESEVQLTRREISKATEEVLLLHLQYKGTSTIYHAGETTSLERGDIEICDCTQPYRLRLFGQDRSLHEMLVVRIPLALLSTQMSNAHALAGAVVSARGDLGNLLSQFIANVWERRHGIDDDVAAKLGQQIIDLVLLAFSGDAVQRTPESSIRAGHLIRMKRFIEAHLSDASLAPAIVAESACISTRYAHELFAAEQCTISSYIIGRRLERCTEMLVAQRHANLTISEIAHMWGFKDASHFGHVFRRKHGISPSAYRSAAPTAASQR